MKTVVIVAGDARGEVLALDQPLSFWGGFDAESGLVVDGHHRQVGEMLSGKIVVMAVGRGSSSSSSVIAEAGRLGTAPAALVMCEADEILATGAIVAEELYGRSMPIVLVDEADYRTVAGAAYVVIAANGTITIS